MQDAPLTKRGLYEGAALTKASGKMELLAKMLKVLHRDNHRVLIFSQVSLIAWTNGGFTSNSRMQCFINETTMSKGFLFNSKKTICTVFSTCLTP